MEGEMVSARQTFDFVVINQEELITKKHLKTAHHVSEYFK